MTTGKPFKTRRGRFSPSILLTPDVFKFGVPLPFAFVPIDMSKSVDKNTGKFIEDTLHGTKHRPNLVSAGQYKLNESCQKTVINLNRCLKNVGSSACDFYNNFLNRSCTK